MRVAFVGLPCSGKTTLARKLASKINAYAVLEPEENEWPNFILDKNFSSFEKWMWFRNKRVSNFLSSIGKEKLVVDSFYDKLFFKYFETDAMSWFLSGESPYFDVVKHISRVDYYELPNVDKLIFVNVEIEFWSNLLVKRGRQYDSNNSMKKNFALQMELLKASEDYCNEFNIDLKIINNKVDTNVVLNELMEFF